MIRNSVNRSAAGVRPAPSEAAATRGSAMRQITTLMGSSAGTLVDSRVSQRGESTKKGNVFRSEKMLISFAAHNLEGRYPVPSRVTLAGVVALLALAAAPAEPV